MWSNGFWADGFWSEGFWDAVSAGVIHPPYVETAYVVAQAAQMSARSKTTTVRLHARVDTTVAFSAEQRFRSRFAERIDALGVKKPVPQQGAAVLTARHTEIVLIVPRAERVLTVPPRLAVMAQRDTRVALSEIERVRAVWEKPQMWADRKSGD